MESEMDMSKLGAIVEPPENLGVTGTAAHR